MLKRKLQRSLVSLWVDKASLCRQSVSITRMMWRWYDVWGFIPLWANSLCYNSSLLWGQNEKHLLKLLETTVPHFFMKWRFNTCERGMNSFLCLNSHTVWRLLKKRFESSGLLPVISHAPLCTFSLYSVLLKKNFFPLLLVWFPRQSHSTLIHIKQPIFTHNKGIM